MRIKKGDNVIVIAGKDKGATGVVGQVFSDDNKVLVEGVNMVKKHRRARKQGEEGQIVERAMPIHISNVQLVDPKTKKGTRIHMKVENGKKTRITQKSGTAV